MRKIILHSAVSLDGYMEGPDHDISWHQVDDELHRYMNAELATMGAFLSGRVSHELMTSFWPTADADPANAGPVAEFAHIWREMPKIVYSRTLTEAGWNTYIEREVDRDEVMALKAQPGGDLVLGGANLTATFLRLGLVDEFRLFVNPVVLGRGTPLFPQSDTPIPTKLVETRTFGNGVVLLRYERSARPAAEKVP